MAIKFENSDSAEVRTNAGEAHDALLENKVERLEKELEEAHRTLGFADTIISVYEGRSAADEAEKSHLRQKNEELEKLLHTDELTGAENAKGFHKSIEGERRKAESGSGFILMYLDANRFKPINDTFGHDAGDFVLKEITQYLRSIAVRPGDKVARLHGDEFGIIFTGTTEEALREKFEKEKLAFTTNYEGHEIVVSLSAGFVAHQEGESVEDFLKRADAAMYENKKKRGDAR